MVNAWYVIELLDVRTCFNDRYRGINHDPDIFPDPHTFRPERHLDPSETINVDVPGTRNEGQLKAHTSAAFLSKSDTYSIS